MSIALISLVTSSLSNINSINRSFLSISEISPFLGEFSKSVQQDSRSPTSNPFNFKELNNYQNYSHKIDIV